jgi:hypothetical protein
VSQGRKGVDGICRLHIINNIVTMFDGQVPQSPYAVPPLRGGLTAQILARRRLTGVRLLVDETMRILDQHTLLPPTPSGQGAFRPVPGTSSPTEDTDQP